MTTQAAARLAELTPFEQLRYARDILEIESRAVAKLASRLGGEFCRAIDYLLNCQGNVVVTGMGKAGLVGQKISATLASTGTPSFFLHPAEAVHGDLGRIHVTDVVLALSQSGETEEVLRLLPPLAALGTPVVAVTSSATNTLARAAKVVIELGPLKEACPLGLAPSTSTTAMLALGDALALVVSRMRCFGHADFARLHPGGSLGRKLSKVEDQMRSLEECRVARDSVSVREVFVELRRPGRRSGAIMLVGEDGRLSGLFTDSDLARLFERKQDDQLDRAIHEVMTSNPRTAPVGSMLSDAVSIMAEHKISELPVVDVSGAPAGLLDITDLVGMIPEESP